MNAHVEYPMRTLIVIFIALITSLRGGIPSNAAPEFADISDWINSEPLEMANLRGRVVLVDFWDYSCINCIRTIPYLNRWYDTYKDKGFLVIGVHSPEFGFEQDRENVNTAVKRFGIRYPVALDNNFATWRAYQNHFWPESYLIDQQGKISYRHIGEGGYVEMENQIRELLGMTPIEEAKNPAPRRVTTQEIYLGSKRAQNYAYQMRLVPNSIQSYAVQLPIKEDEVGLVGLWRVSPESITSASSNCKIYLNFTAGKVHMVLAGDSADPITLLYNGNPLPEKYYSQDMDSEGQIFLDGDREYDIADFHGELKQGTLTITLPPGISAYTFTFGS